MKPAKSFVDVATGDEIVVRLVNLGNVTFAEFVRSRDGVVLFVSKWSDVFPMEPK